MNRGGKRQANSPVGASFKDPRRENQNTQSNRFDALGDYESDGGGSWTDVTNRRNQPRTNNEHTKPTEQTNPQSDRPTFASTVNVRKPDVRFGYPDENMSGFRTSGLMYHSSGSLA